MMTTNYRLHLNLITYYYISTNIIIKKECLTRIVINRRPKGFIIVVVDIIISTYLSIAITAFLIMIGTLLSVLPSSLDLLSKLSFAIREYQGY